MLIDPLEIERESLRIIHEAVSDYSGSAENLPIIERVIHATADFDFLDTLYFSENAVSLGRDALRVHTPVITDTKMLCAGISKRYGTETVCYVSDPETITEAHSRGVTRSVVNIERAVQNYPSGIYAIGNAPTALIRLCELILEGRANPALVIGVPVGFVNVIEAKNMLASLPDIPRIIAFGSKGGTTVACAIMNALIYGLCAQG